MMRLLVRLYPRAWRRRYGAEFTALLEQQPASPGTVLDIVRGALDAHVTERKERRAQAALDRPGQGKEHEMKRRRQGYNCSFCGKPRDGVRRLIAGPGVYICDGCVTLCNEIIAKDEHTPSASQRGGPDRPAGRRRIPWWQRLLGRADHAPIQASEGAMPGLL